MDEQLNRQGNDSNFHCPDCDLVVHRNDKDNHLNGGRHKYRIRLIKHESNKIDPQFQCSVCDREFTDTHFYTIHMGSKTHKRNLRRVNKHNKNGLQANDKKKAAKASVTTEFKPTGRRVQIQGIESYTTINDFRDVCDYKSVREKYRPRNTKNPEGINKSYICSVAAYWAVSLTLDPNVQDFKISLNDKEWGDFGDAVVQIDLKETKEQSSLTTTFAIQFRDISNNVKDITSLGEGRFGLAKFLTQINLIKLRTDVENKKFVVFTTAHPEAKMERQIQLKNEVLHKTKQECDCKGDNKDKEVSVVAKTLSNRRKLLINTSDDNDNIFFFFCTDKIHNLPRIYMYTHQQKQKHFGTWINDLVSRSIYDQSVDIHRDFIKYIEYWVDGYLGGNYKLKKEDVLVKLGHLLLYKFKIPPVVRTMESKNYGIWNLAVNSVDVTVLQKHPVVIPKVCEPLNLRIETELGIVINTTTSSINLAQNTIEKIQNPVLKMYLFEETLGEIQDDIPLEMVYDFCWKAGLIPFLLQVEDLKNLEHVLNIVALLKSLGLTRRYFLMIPDETVRTSLRYYRTLNFFVTVDDIANKIPSFLLDYVKISVTDSFSLSLKNIQDSDIFFQKTLNAHEFFDMSLENYSFKPFSNILARKDGRETQLVLADDTMLKLKKEVDSKDEMKLVLLEHKSGMERQFLRGIKPSLFS